MKRVGDVVLSERKALIIDNSGVIADLHLGIEGSLEEKGVAIPPLQLDDLVEEVMKLIDEFSLKQIIIAGDLKHEFGKNLPTEWRDVERFIREIREVVELKVVRGNHDNFLQAILRKMNVDFYDSYDLFGYRVIHGHVDVNFDKIIMGHEHPTIKIRHEGVIYSFQCFLHGKKAGREVWVLPSFSHLFSGNNILENDFISPVMREFSKKDVDIYAIEDEIYELGSLESVVRFV